MLDLQKTIADFHALPPQQKYDQLVKIFSSIKEKNQNCAYIYEKLTTKPDLFDDELMESVFGEVMEVYERIDEETKHIQLTHFEKSFACIEHLHHLEKQERAEEEQACEELLQF